MENKQIIIDENICEYYSDTKEDEEGAYPIVGWCNNNYCKCDDIPFDECLVKAIQYCKLKDKQLKCKEQELNDYKKQFKADTKEMENYQNEIVRHLESIEYWQHQAEAKEQECNKLYIQLKADEEYHKEEENTLRKIIKNKEERNIELYKENSKLKQTLNEIKPTLEFYANSKMGEEQPDKTYHIMLNGGYIMVYDPKPARQALQKISSNRCLLAGTNRIKR